jgi:hypothetical protein
MVLSSHVIMIPNGWRTFMRRTAFLIVAVSLLFLQPSMAAKPLRDDTVGQYQLIFRGCYSGTGRGQVNKNSVTIRGTVFDENGARLDFNSGGMKLENRRFRDRLTVGATTVIISGRVDPSGGALRKARLICTFTATGAGFGRVVGEHN